MSAIQIDPKLNQSEDVANLVLLLTQEFNTQLPKLSLPQILATALRPGLNDTTLANAVISRFNEIGIPNGPLVEGSPNVMEAFVRVFADEIVNAIQTQMRIDVAVDPGIVVVSTGTSPAGPIAATGSNPAPAAGSAAAT